MNPSENYMQHFTTISGSTAVFGMVIANLQVASS
jgi:hypothetical protein